MKRLLILMFVLLPVLSYAKDVVIVKDATVIVPESQSVDQVVKYTTDELARKASEEAGVSIYASTELIDGKITKEEVKLQTANVAKISQVEKRVFTDKKGRTHVYLKIKASINTDDLNKHLQLLTQNENLRKQLEQERKEKEKLAEEMRKASKEEFSDLNDEAERIAKAHQVRIALLEKDAAYAERVLQESIDKQNREREKQAKQLEEMRQAAKKKEEEDKKKILEAHDKEKKAELEYQARLNELIREAAINDKILSSESDNTLEFVMAEVTGVRAKFAALVRAFEAEKKANKKTMDIFYREQINLIKSRQFLEEAPKEKGEWETTAAYNARIIEYEKRKSDFEKQKSSDLYQADLDYKEKIATNEVETKKELLKALEPFYIRLKNYNNGKFVSSKVNRAVINFGDKDIDHNTLNFTVKLGMKTYDYIYNFDNIDDFKTMYETRFSFVAVPLYGLVPSGKGGKSYLHGFNVIHLGMKKEVWYPVQEADKIFPEILEYERMYNEVYLPDNANTQDNTNVDENSSSVSESFQYSASSNTSDMKRKASRGKKSDKFFDYGINLAIGTEDSSFFSEFGIKYGKRYNNFAIYYNLAAVVGVAGENSYSNDRSYDSRYDRYSPPKPTSTTNWGVTTGVGISYHILFNFHLFGEINALYLSPNTINKSGFGGSAKAGVMYNINDIFKMGIYFGSYFGDIDYNNPLVIGFSFYM